MARNGEDPIDVQEKRFGYFPRAFMWRGRRYRVSKVVKSWTVRRKRRRELVERRCFRVRCDAGTFDLNHDLRINTWHLQRVQTGG